jgi:hypothetical protein
MLGRHVPSPRSKASWWWERTRLERGRGVERRGRLYWIWQLRLQGLVEDGKGASRVVSRENCAAIYRTGAWLYLYRRGGTVSRADHNGRSRGAKPRDPSLGARWLSRVGEPQAQGMSSLGKHCACRLVRTASCCPRHRSSAGVSHCGQSSSASLNAPRIAARISALALDACAASGACEGLLQRRKSCLDSPTRSCLCISSLP